MRCRSGDVAVRFEGLGEQALGQALQLGALRPVGGGQVLDLVAQFEPRITSQMLMTKAESDWVATAAADHDRVGGHRRAVCTRAKIHTVSACTS